MTAHAAITALADGAGQIGFIRPKSVFVNQSQNVRFKRGLSQNADLRTMHVLQIVPFSPRQGLDTLPVLFTLVLHGAVEIVKTKYYIRDIRMERKAREGNLWAQSEVARQIGVPNSRMRSIEAGTIQPTPQQLSRLATYFGLSVRDFSLPPTPTPDRKRASPIRTWMTLDSVCRIFHISRKAAYNYIKRGHWATEQRGARVYVRTKDVKEKNGYKTPKHKPKK